jgi:hypothetical protein
MRITDDSSIFMADKNQIEGGYVKAKTKNGFPPKVCAHCGREFEWRKKWARDWERVKYCSERCKAGK